MSDFVLLNGVFFLVKAASGVDVFFLGYFKQQMQPAKEEKPTKYIVKHYTFLDENFYS